MPVRADGAVGGPHVVQAPPAEPDETDADGTRELSGSGRLSKTAGKLREAAGEHAIRARSALNPNAEATPNLVGVKILSGDRFGDPTVSRDA